VGGTHEVTILELAETDQANDRVALAHRFHSVQHGYEAGSKIWCARPDITKVNKLIGYEPTCPSGRLESIIEDQRHVCASGCFGPV